MSSFKSSENIQKKKDGPDIHVSVSENQPSSVTLNELAMKASKSYCKFKLQQRSFYNDKCGSNNLHCLEYMNLNL